MSQLLAASISSDTSCQHFVLRGTQQNAEAYISLWNKASSSTRVFHVCRSCVPPVYNNSHGDGHCKQVSVQSFQSSFHEVWLQSFTSDARRSQMLFRVADGIRLALQAVGCRNIAVPCHRRAQQPLTVLEVRSRPSQTSQAADLRSLKVFPSCRPYRT